MIQKKEYVAIVTRLFDAELGQQNSLQWSIDFNLECCIATLDWMFSFKGTNAYKLIFVIRMDLDWVCISKIGTTDDSAHSIPECYVILGTLIELGLLKWATPEDEVRFLLKRLDDIKFMLCIKEK